MNRVWNVSGVDNFSRTVNVAFATAPGPASIFPVTGVTSARSDAIVTTTSGGVTVRVDQQTYFNAATLQIVGLRSSVDGQPAVCDVATAVGAAPPSSARIPSRGTLATLDAREGCASGSASAGTITVEWVLTAENGIAYFCVESTQRSGGTVVAFEQDCVQTALDGALGPAARITVQANGVSVTAR